MRDVSRLLTGHLLRECGRQVTLWGGGGIKHNVKMTLFSAKIVWTSPLNFFFNNYKKNNKKFL